jgi:hypothetical protein
MQIAPRWLVTDYFLAKARGSRWADPSLAHLVSEDRSSGVNGGTTFGAIVLIADPRLAGALYSLWNCDLELERLNRHDKDYPIRLMNIQQKLTSVMSMVRPSHGDDEATMSYFAQAISARMDGRGKSITAPPLRLAEHPEIRKLWADLILADENMALAFSNITGGRSIYRSAGAENKTSINRQDRGEARKDQIELDFLLRSYDTPKPSEFLSEAVGLLSSNTLVRDENGALTLKPKQSKDDGDRPVEDTPRTAIAA